MANTYSWTINNLDVRPSENGLTDVVYNIHWTYTAVSDQLDPEGNVYSTSLIGTSPVGEPDASDFVSFENLTQQDVEAWIGQDASVGGIQEAADANIEALITPISETKDVPW
jgi:hypothetical protein